MVELGYLGKGDIDEGPLTARNEIRPLRQGQAGKQLCGHPMKTGLDRARGCEKSHVFEVAHYSLLSCTSIIPELRLSTPLHSP